MDPIADMINSINNAYAVSKEEVEIYPFSNLKYNILKLFKKQDYIEDVVKRGRATSKKIIVTLKYDKQGRPIIRKIKKVSKPGQKIYQKVDELKPFKSGFGEIIISTSKGLLTGKEAKKIKIGGEIICKVF